MACGVSTVVEFLLLPKQREKMQITSFRVLKKLYLTIACGSSTVVEHSANHPKVGFQCSPLLRAPCFTHTQ
jgi:hypothetical protein